MLTGKGLSVFLGVVTAFIFRMKQFQNSEVAVPVGAAFNYEVPTGVSTYTGTENTCNDRTTTFCNTYVVHI